MTNEADTIGLAEVLFDSRRRDVVLKEYALGDEAIQYMRKELRKGHELARNLLGLPLEEGRVSTYLPADAEAHLLDFESGGVGSGEENREVAALIKGHMDHSTSGIPICVLEHSGASKGDPFLRQVEWPFFTVGDEAYVFAGAQDTVETITTDVKAIRWYPGIGAVSTLQPGTPLPADRGEREADLLRMVAAGAELVVIATYDAEGWLVWRPPSDRSPRS